MMFEINYLAVLVSAVAMMVLGYLWYGPLFGKPWMKLTEMSEKDMKGNTGIAMAKTYGLMFVSALILSYVFDHILIAFQTASVGMAVQGAIWTWLGFIATTMFSGVLFAKKPVKLFVIDAGYYLVGLIIVGVILTMWQ